MSPPTAASEALFAGLGTRESYVRIAATAIYFYDYLLTLPEEIRLYRRLQPWYRPTFIVGSYALSRYTTALYLIFSQAVYFTPHLSQDLCNHWVLLSGSFRTLSLATTALIFIWRASTVWPARWVKILSWSLWIVATAIYASTALTATSRSLVFVDDCINGKSTSPIPSYVNWILWCVFDIVTCAIVFVKLRQNAEGGRWQRFSVLFFRQSLGYMLLSVALYVIQAVFFALPSSLGLTTYTSSLAAAFAAIWAQRMVTSLHQLRGAQELRDLIEERQRKKRYSLASLRPGFSKRETAETAVTTLGGLPILPLHDANEKRGSESAGSHTTANLIPLESPPSTIPGFETPQVASRSSRTRSEDLAGPAAAGRTRDRRLSQQAQSFSTRLKMASADSFLEGLNYLSPPTSVENTPANGTADPARRSQYDLSAPVDGQAVAAQLDAWTNVAFDFESFVGAPPSFDRAFDRLVPGGSSLGVFAAGTGDIALTAASPSSFIMPVSTDGIVASAFDSARHPQSPVLQGSGNLDSHTTGVGTLNQDQLDDEANRKAYEEDKRRRNTAASARFRVKKKQREQALEQNAKELRDKVVTLEKEVDALKSENGWLRNLVLERGGTIAKKDDALDAFATSGTKRSRAKTTVA